MNERRAILETTRGYGLHDSLITKEIVRQACPCVSNHVPDTNFPLKNLDGPSQGVRESNPLDSNERFPLSLPPFPGFPWRDVISLYIHSKVLTFPSRRGRYRPHPSQTRTSPIKASGSSLHRFAHVSV